MCCGGGDAPQSPDPYATANAQKNAYIESATANAYLNRMDEVTPFGSVHYETLDDGNTNNSPGPGVGKGALGTGNLFGSGALGQLGITQNRQVPRMRRVVSLDPDEQKILDLSRGNKIALGELAQGKISDVADAFGTPFSFSGAPGAGFGMLNRAKALAQSSGPDLSAYEALAMKGGPRLDEAARQQVQDAYYRRETAELDPRYKRQQMDLETQLANQGIARGSQAWNQATNQFARQKDRAYGDAMDRAITGGGAEQQRLFNMRSTRRQQNLGALANLYNMQSGKRRDQLAAYTNLFGLSQSGRQNWLQEQLTKRKLSMDELNMLLGKSEGYNVPQFKNPSDINVTAPDIQGLISGNYKNQLDIWGQNQADDNALTGNIIKGLGSAAAGYAGSAAGSAALAALSW